MDYHQLFKVRFRTIGDIPFEFIYNILGAANEFAPEWLMKVPEKVCAVFQTDDSEPPELEEDPAYAQVTAIPSSRQNLYRSVSRESLSTSSSDGNIHIFDETFGVIPKHVQDLWKRQGREATVRREELIANKRNRQIPPVRFSNSAPHSPTGDDTQQLRNPIKSQPPKNELDDTRTPSHPVEFCRNEDH